MSLAKGTAMLFSAFFPKLPNQEQKNPPDWSILDVWALLSFKFVDTLLSKAFVSADFWLLIS